MALPGFTDKTPDKMHVKSANSEACRDAPPRQAVANIERHQNPTELRNRKNTAGMLVSSTFPRHVKGAPMNKNADLSERVGDRLIKDLTTRQINELNYFLRLDVPKMRTWLEEHQPGYENDPAFLLLRVENPSLSEAELLGKFGTTVWLEQYCPNYKQVVLEEQDRDFFRKRALVPPKQSTDEARRAYSALQLEQHTDEPTDVYALRYIAHRKEKGQAASELEMVVLAPSPQQCHLSTFIYEGCAYRLDPLDAPIRVPEKGWEWVADENGPEVDGTGAGYRDTPWRNIDLIMVADRIAPTCMANWFWGCKKLKAILGTSLIDTSYATSMHCTFIGCGSLSVLDLSTWETPLVSDFDGMFASCRSLVELNLSNFTFSQAVSTSSMFEECASLTSVMLPPLKAPNLENANFMFAHCINLQRLSMSGCSLPSLRYAAGMFSRCQSLRSIDLSGTGPQNLASMAYLLYGCHSLEHLSMPGFSPSQQDEPWMENAFKGCSQLNMIPGTLIYLLMSGEGINV